LRLQDEVRGPLIAHTPSNPPLGGEKQLGSKSHMVAPTREPTPKKGSRNSLTAGEQRCTQSRDRLVVKGDRQSPGSRKEGKVIWLKNPPGNQRSGDKIGGGSIAEKTSSLKLPWGLSPSSQTKKRKVTP